MTDSNIAKSLLDNKEEEKTESNIVDNLNKQPSDFTNVFKTESKFDDYVNNTLFDEETFDFASQDFDISNNIFNGTDKIKLCGSYVKSPLCWALSVSKNSKLNNYSKNINIFHQLDNVPLE